MVKALQEEWDRITVEEFNELQKLPNHYAARLHVIGGNKFHA